MPDPVSLSAILEIVKKIAEHVGGHKLYEEIAPRLKKLTSGEKDRCLLYDLSVLTKTYTGERGCSADLGYKTIMDWTAGAIIGINDFDKLVKIHVSPQKFSRNPGKPKWQEASEAGHNFLVNPPREGEKPKVTHSERIIRVSSAEVDQSKNTLELRVQEAEYFDQTHSNLIMDFDQDNPQRHVTLRNQLCTEYGNVLPPLNDDRLANTLGVACMIYYVADNKGQPEFVPYIVRRVKDVAVYPGGYHCSSSGAAKWADDKTNATTFSSFATSQMWSEIDEELGLKETDFYDFRPLAFCREMLRGGKPQLFYGGITRLNRAQLREKRAQARRIQKARNNRPEIVENLIKSDDFVPASSDLKEAFSKHGKKMTFECSAAWDFGQRYIEQWKNVNRTSP